MTMENSNNNNELHELSQLRSQLELLRNKLEKEEIVNRRILQNAIRRSVSSLHRKGLFFVIIGLAAIPYMIWAFGFMGFSTLSCVVTCIFLAIAVAHTIWSHYGLSPDHFANDDLVLFGRRVAALKRRYTSWFYFSIPFLVVWFFIMWREVMSLNPSHEMVIAITSGAAVGGIIGLIAGIRMWRSVQRTASQLLEQIETLTTINR